MAAVLDAWEHDGSAGISARALAQAAGAPVSAIYYHFGDLDHLYVAASSAAQARAAAWCARQLDMLAPVESLPPQAFPGLLAALIDDWAHANRGLAFAWRECQLLAARKPDHAAALAGWTAMWRAFWQGVTGRFGLGDMAEQTCAFFNGESFFHLLQWRRAIDRACLDETCSGWSQWLAGGLAAEGPWRALARTEAMRTNTSPRALSGVAERIATAAAEIIAHEGLAKLTHRAVATRSGLTLGVVSYNCRTSADLMNAAFEAMYALLVPQSTEDMLTLPDYDAATVRASMNESSAEQRGWMLALEEFMLAVARDPARQGFAAQLRYLRGRTSGRVLSILLDRRPVSPLDSALLSAFSLGLERRADATVTGVRGPTDLLDPLLDRLR